MSNADFDDEPEIERAVPPRARQTKVTGNKAGKKKGSGRPPTVPRAAEMARAEAPVRRNSPRPAPDREPTREMARENPRPGAVVVVSRTGERLTRRRIGTGDKFDVPLNERPRGWDYQWNPVTVLGQKIGEIVEQGDLQMMENGWRPVPASRHPGRWTPPGYEGSIVMEGLRLEERPMELSLEAKAEDEARAKAQVRDRTDALRLTQQNLPGAKVAKQRGQAGGMKMDFSDDGHDIPRPQHELEIE